MAIDYQQTQTSDSVDSGSHCSGRTDSFQWSKVCEDGGTPGTLELSTALSAGQTLNIKGRFAITPAPSVSWDAGTWTVRVNVTTANMNVTIEEVHICRLNSSEVNQAKIGSATGLAINCGTVGVKSINVTGVAQTPVAGDIVLVQIVCTNAQSMSLQSIGVTPSEIISSPFTAAAVGVTGTFAAALAGASLSASAKVSAKGSLAIALAGATMAATGKLRAAGALASSLSDFTLAGSGKVAAKGSFASALDAFVFDASGTSEAGATVSGALSSTLSPFTLAASGKVATKGSFAAAVDGFTLAADGKVAAKGSFSAAVDALTLTAEGKVAAMGILAATVDAFTLAAEGRIVGRGVLASTLDGATLSASGKVISRSSFATSLDAFTLAASGVVGDVVAGAFSAQLEPAVLDANGKITVRGSFGPTLEQMLLSATGAVVLPAGEEYVGDYRGRGGRKLDDYDTHRLIHEYHDERALALERATDTPASDADDRKPKPLRQPGGTKARQGGEHQFPAGGAFALVDAPVASPLPIARPKPAAQALAPRAADDAQNNVEVLRKERDDMELLALMSMVVVADSDHG